MRLVLAELAAGVALVAIIAATMRHACDPQRDRRLYAGRHHLAGGAR